MDEYINHIYFGKYILWYLRKRGCKSLCNNNNKYELWGEYVQFYSHEVSPFKLNPKYVYREDIEKKFVLYVESKVYVINSYDDSELNTNNIHILSKLVAPYILDINKSYSYKS